MPSAVFAAVYGFFSVSAWGFLPAFIAQDAPTPPKSMVQQTAAAQILLILLVIMIYFLLIYLLLFDKKRSFFLLPFILGPLGGWIPFFGESGL